MTKTQCIALREDFLDFCKKKNWTNPQAVTLTLKRRRQVGMVWVSLLDGDAQANLKHFRNVIRKKLRRYGFPKAAELQCVSVLEGTNDVRPHFHLMLDRPECIGQEEYTALIATEWSRTNWGLPRVRVERCFSEQGWLNYMTKLRTKSDYADAIDWTNFK